MMKRLSLKYLLAAVVLVIPLGSILASSTLVVQLKSGATETFSLFDKPELTMVGSRMNVKSASVETSYERSDIKSFYFVNSGTGIEETVEEKVSFKQIATNQFQISGLSDKDRIVVSNLTGQTFGHVVSKDGPDAFVDLDGCPQGVYVIKIGKKQTVKIIKK